MYYHECVKWRGLVSYATTDGFMTKVWVGALVGIANALIATTSVFLAMSLGV